MDSQQEAMGSVVDKPDVKAGMVRKDMDDLKIENVRFLKKTTAYVESLEEGTIVGKLYDEIPEFMYRIEQAIKGVEDVLDEEDEKMEILNKTAEVPQVPDAGLRAAPSLEEDGVDDEADAADDIDEVITDQCVDD